MEQKTSVIFKRFDRFFVHYQVKVSVEICSIGKKIREKKEVGYKIIKLCSNMHLKHCFQISRFSFITFQCKLTHRSFAFLVTSATMAPTHHIESISILVASFDTYSAQLRIGFSRNLFLIGNDSKIGFFNQWTGRKALAPSWLSTASLCTVG